MCRFIYQWLRRGLPGPMATPRPNVLYTLPSKNATHATLNVEILQFDGEIRLRHRVGDATITETLQ